MEPEGATAVVIGVAVVGFVVWMFAVQTMLRATRERRALADEDALAIGTRQPGWHNHRNRRSGRKSSRALSQTC